MEKVAKINPCLKNVHVHYRNEIYADHFDDGEKDHEGMSLFTKKSQIRFSKERGITGYVARTGEVRISLTKSRSIVQTRSSPPLLGFNDEMFRVIHAIYVHFPLVLIKELSSECYCVKHGS